MNNGVNGISWVGCSLCKQERIGRQYSKQEKEKRIKRVTSKIGLPVVTIVFCVALNDVEGVDETALFAPVGRRLVQY